MWYVAPTKNDLTFFTAPCWVLMLPIRRIRQRHSSQNETLYSYTGTQGSQCVGKENPKLTQTRERRTKVYDVLHVDRDLVSLQHHRYRWCSSRSSRSSRACALIILHASHASLCCEISTLGCDIFTIVIMFVYITRI
jgi:hypothetical protein